ncbi:MAG: hypothetical protein FRX49_01454 [Trebouxia sp. A1-2]|nr:MAG: hypothetical protein FRX49_01454 [Trebouxia sp. A1-2]
MAPVGGLSMKSKPTRSSKPRALSCRATVAKLTRWISGQVVGASWLKLASVKSLKALPAASRPAHQPHLCMPGMLHNAAAVLARAFTKPVSTTYRTPGTVTEVSAILVEQFQKDIHGRQEDLKRKQMQWEPQRHPILQSPAAALLANAAHTLLNLGGGGVV